MSYNMILLTNVSSGIYSLAATIKDLIVYV
jgi:hypothetical protein